MLSVIGKGSRKMCTLHLTKVYFCHLCHNGCETWTLNDHSITGNRVNVVAWNNNFDIFFLDFGGKVLNHTIFLSNLCRPIG